MRQLDPAYDVAYREDTGYVRRKEIVHHNPPVLHTNRDIRVEQSFRIRRPAHRYQHRVHLCLPVPALMHVAAFQAFLNLHDLFQDTLLVYLYPTARQNLFQRIRELLIHIRQKAVRYLHDRHLPPKRVKYRGKFYSDHASAKDQKPWIPALIRQKQFLTGHHSRQVHAGDVDHPRFRPRCDQDIFPCVILRPSILHRNSHSSVILNRRRTADRYDPKLREFPFKFLSHGCRRQTLIFVDLLQVESHLLCKQPKLLTACHISVQRCRMYQRLRRDTPPVNTGSSHISFINDRDRHSQFCCLFRRHITARPGPDNDQVILFPHHISSS